jgi:hypothetical protein
MKKNFLILCLLLTSAAYSQNNLQFSKVITESFSIASGEYGAGIQFSTLKTVPTGKVWKIESMGCNTENYGNGFEINGIKNSFYTNQAYSPFKQGPLWLSAGTTFRLFNNSNQPQNSCYISILEFNIVQ